MTFTRAVIESFRRNPVPFLWLSNTGLSASILYLGFDLPNLTLAVLGAWGLGGSVGYVGGYTHLAVRLYNGSFLDLLTHTATELTEGGDNE